MIPNPTRVARLRKLKQVAIALGYQIEVSADGAEERLIRPDGSVAVIARRDQLPATDARPTE